MKRHPVHRRGHSELADTIIDVAAGIIKPCQRFLVLRFGVVRTGEVGRTADRLGQLIVDRAERHFRRLAGRDLLRRRDQALDVIGEREAGRQAAGHAAEEFALAPAGVEPPAPGAMIASASPPRFPPGLGDVVGEFERPMIPAQFLARRGDFVGAERGTMGGGGALLVGRALADDRPAGDQRRPRIGQRGVDGAADVGPVVAVAADDMPAISRVASLDILRGRKAGRAVDGDPIIVPQDGQAA